MLYDASGYKTSPKVVAQQILREQMPSIELAAYRQAADLHPAATDRELSLVHEQYKKLLTRMKKTAGIE